MEAFEYLSVLVSIVLGLGIAQILMGFARWLENRGTLKAYPPAIAWAAFLLLLHVQTWWSMFELQHWPEWTFLQFAVVLLQPIVLFMLAVLIFPSAASPLHDMREYFFGQRRWFFGFLLALLLTSLMKDVVRKELPEATNLAFHGAFAIVSLTGLLSARERIQQALAYSSVAVFAVYIAILFAEL